MVLIRTVLGHQLHLRPAGQAVRGVGVRRGDAELLHRIKRHGQGACKGRLILPVVCVDAVYSDVCLVAAHPIDRTFPRIERGDRPHREAVRIGLPCKHNAGLECEQVDHVACQERQILNLLLPNRVANRCVLSIKCRGRGFHDHSLGHGAQFQAHVQTCRCGHENADLGCDESSEAILEYFELISPGWKLGEVIFTAVVGLHRAGNAAGSVRGRDFGTDHRGTCRVGDLPLQAAHVLSAERRTCQQRAEQYHQTANRK